MPTRAGPACGWALSYIETLLASYPRLDLQDIVCSTGAKRPLSLAAGIVLLEARSCRMDPENAISFVDRAIMRANAEVKRWYQERYDITPTPPRGALGVRPS